MEYTDRGRYYALKRGKCHSIITLSRGLTQVLMEKGGFRNKDNLVATYNDRTGEIILKKSLR